MILLGVIGVVLIAAVVIVLARPMGDEPLRPALIPPPKGIGVAVIVEGLDADAKTASARIIAVTGARVRRPVVLRSTIPAVTELTIESGGLVQEQSITLPLASGDVSDYPFDRYTEEFALAAEFSDPRPRGPRRVPLAVDIDLSVAGFSGSAEGRRGRDGSDVVDLRFERTEITVAWAAIMMLINWALAAAAIGVALAVILGERDWESRHLAWLTAAVFALTAFRSNAPGQPPLGTFFDYASFFWAQAIVALMLLALVVRYLVVDRGRLGM